MHFYHVWTDGHWLKPAEEHMALLAASGLSPEMYVGFVGHDIREAWSWFLSQCPDVKLAAKADQGHEAVTLHAMHEWCKDNPGRKTLYAHTKGAFHDERLNDAWRLAMARKLVLHGRERLPELDTYDVVGMHWITPRQFSFNKVPNPFFAGNFWWARSEYVARLPEIDLAGERHVAEGWLGQGNPKVLDLHPGWPVY